MNHHVARCFLFFRQRLRRLQRALLVAVVVLVAAPAALMTGPSPGRLVVLVVVLGVYLWRKISQLFWIRRTQRQLMLEEQFIRHGPGPRQLALCLRRRGHLWYRSVTFRSLKAWLRGPARRVATRNQAFVCRLFRKQFGGIRPPRTQIDVALFVVLLLCWLWAVPGSVLRTESVVLMAGLVAMLVLLITEVVQAVLRHDVRDVYYRFTTLLSAWAVHHPFQDVVPVSRSASYHHEAVYRSPEIPTWETVDVVSVRSAVRQP